VSSTYVWSPGQRALLRFLEREGLLQGLPEPPAGEAAPSDDLLFAAIADAVAPAVLAERIAAKLHLPLLEADEVVDPAAGALLAETVATRCGAIPVGLQGELLEVAIANPLDLDRVKTIEFATGRRVRIVVATPATVQRLLVHLYGGAEPAPAEEPPGVADAPAAAAEVAVVPEGATLRAALAPRRQRVLLLVADPSDRDRVAGALHDAAPEWLVVTAQDVAEAHALVALTWPDVVLVDSEATAADLDAGAMAPVPRLVAGDCRDLPEIIARTRTVIDTAQRG
jgi:hypothetical protein